MFGHHPRPARAGTAALRGFTMVELIVALLIVGVLSAIAAVSFTAVTHESRAEVAQMELRTIGAEMLTRAALSSSDLTRTQALEAIAETTGEVVVDGLSASGVTVRGGATTPAEGEYALGFDNGGGQPGDARGRRAALLTTVEGTTYAFVVSRDTLQTAEFTAPAGGTPGAVLVSAPPAPTPSAPTPTPPAAPTPAPNPTPSPSPSPTPTTPTPTTPTTTPNLSPAPVTGPVCAAAYSTVSSWPGGYQGQILVTTTRDTLPSWAVAWTRTGGKALAEVTGGVLGMSGSVYTVVNAPGKGQVTPDAPVTITFTGKGAAPSSPIAVSCAGG